MNLIAQTGAGVGKDQKLPCKSASLHGITTSTEPVVAVVIPCFRVRRHILSVLARIPRQVAFVFVVDDCCPEGSGSVVEEQCQDDRVHVLYQTENSGVGGATKAGVTAALESSAEIIVKIDGDGQMAPELIPNLIDPIISGVADFTKGNRFFNLEDVRSMPKVRLVGNAGLSFFSKLSTGYWSLFDPTNGFIAIHAEVARWVPWAKIGDRYFFETDLLFRLNILQAVVVELPMTAVYEGESSSLNPMKELPRFIAGHARNFAKRIFYMYFLRDFNIASLELVTGLLALLFGVVFGATHWGADGMPATAGTVMLAALPVLVGIQLIISFFSYDMRSIQSLPLSRRLPRKRDDRSLVDELPQ